MANRRNTIQKDLVRNAVYEMKRHVTANEVYAVSYTHLDVYKRQFYRTTECDEYYVSDWSGSDYHHSVHTFWKKNQKADAACIRRNRTNKGSKSGI